MLWRAQGIDCNVRLRKWTYLSLAAACNNAWRTAFYHQPLILWTILSRLDLLTTLAIWAERERRAIINFVVRFRPQAGVAVIAFGTLDKHGVNVPVVPIGLNYFRGHRFRARAVVEFGPPVRISEELHELYK